jgi:hypothetical protein
LQRIVQRSTIFLNSGSIRKQNLGKELAPKSDRLYCLHVEQNLLCNFSQQEEVSMTTQQIIQLERGVNGVEVEAILVSLTDKNLIDVERYWQPHLEETSEADQFWDWEQKHRIYTRNAQYESYAIECEGMTQGLMLVAIRGYRSWIESQRRLVYVHSIATAPWNRTQLQNPVEYRLVGTTLLEFARFRSYELGYGGLVGLHALPGAEGFYRKLQFMDCGVDEEKENLAYFEWYQRQSTESDEWDEWEDETDGI